MLKSFMYFCVIVLAFAGSDVLAGPQAEPAHSQQEGQQPDWVAAGGGKQEFAVASVRLSAVGTPYQASVPLDGLDGPMSGNLFVANAPVMAYLLFAYKINDSTEARALYAALPLWARTQFYKVEARADGTPTRDQVRLMVQALLVERFKVAIHWEMRRDEEYALTLVKPDTIGPQVRPDPDSILCVPTANESPSNDHAVHCGVTAWTANGEEFVKMAGVSMEQVADYLAGTGAAKAGGDYRPMSGVNKTGLSGRFDLELHFAHDPGAATEGPMPSGPLFEEALRKQLGMKLTREIGPVMIPVLLHLEAPSPQQQQ